MRQGWEWPGALDDVFLMVWFVEVLVCVLVWLVECCTVYTEWEPLYSGMCMCRGQVMTAN